MLFFNKGKNLEFVGEQLAEAATIETIYEKGIISGIMIFLHGEQSTIKKVIENSAAKATFKLTIEKRIMNNKYVDTRIAELNDLFPYKTKEHDVSKAGRAVVTEHFEPLFGWLP